ncbi:MAG: hypothetical protein FWC71_03185 [Defluviitaleaceae bacterium]|nr:hypothetical protein [Defluviitaleaceae bacterium]
MMHAYKKEKQPDNRVACVPHIPRTFFDNADVTYVLNEAINGFQHEEKEAIYFHCVLGVTVSEIATITRLTQQHVYNTLNLYAERLETRLRFFKKFVPHDKDEVLPVGEILFSDGGICH